MLSKGPLFSEANCLHEVRIAFGFQMVSVSAESGSRGIFASVCVGWILGMLRTENPTSCCIECVGVGVLLG